MLYAKTNNTVFKIDKVKDAIYQSLEQDKAEDIVVIDLDGKTDIASCMIIASGRSGRHVSSVADNVVTRLKDQGLGSFACEGRQQGDWVLIDAADIIVHVFRPEVRAFYNLEELWGVPKVAQREQEEVFA